MWSRRQTLLQVAVCSLQCTRLRMVPDQLVLFIGDMRRCLCGRGGRLDRGGGGNVVVMSESGVNAVVMILGMFLDLMPSLVYRRAARVLDGGRRVLGGGGGVGRVLGAMGRQDGTVVASVGSVDGVVVFLGVSLDRGPSMGNGRGMGRLCVWCLGRYRVWCLGICCVWCLGRHCT